MWRNRGKVNLKAFFDLVGLANVKNLHCNNIIIIFAEK